MEEDKMSKQIVPLNVDYSSKKEGKSNTILMKLRKGKMECKCQNKSVNKFQDKNVQKIYNMRMIK